MAYQMKDSPHKRGVIEGTDSALKLASLAYKAVTKGKKIYKAALSKAKVFSFIYFGNLCLK